MTIDPKGQVYGGIIRLASSPHSDMHGLARAVVRTKFFAGVIDSLARLGIRILSQDLGRTWTISQSAVEHEITADLYGEVFTCSLVLAYLKPEHYTHIPFPTGETGKTFGII